jgi:hypothetical protein
MVPVTTNRLSPLASSLTRTRNHCEKLNSTPPLKTAFTVGHSLLRRIRIDLKQDSIERINKKIDTLTKRQLLRNKKILHSLGNNTESLSRLWTQSSNRLQQLKTLPPDRKIDKEKVERLEKLYQHPWKMQSAYLAACDILKMPVDEQAAPLKKLLADTQCRDASKAITRAYVHYTDGIYPLSTKLIPLMEERDQQWLEQEALEQEALETLEQLDRYLDNV